jgi:hypothetical protein
MNAKAVFLQDKDLVNWWVSVVHDSRYEKVMALGLATLAMKKPPTEVLMGACELDTILTTFPDPDFTSKPFPSPGLVHEIPKRKTGTEPETDKPKA